MKCNCHVQETCTLYVHRIVLLISTFKMNYLASLYLERTAVSSGVVFPIGVLVASTY